MKHTKCKKEVECKHKNLAYCPKCKVVWCKDCEKEWPEKEYVYYPWYYGYYTNPCPIKITDTTSNITWDDSTGNKCTHIQ